MTRSYSTSVIPSISISPSKTNNICYTHSHQDKSKFKENSKDASSTRRKSSSCILSFPSTAKSSPKEATVEVACECNYNGTFFRMLCMPIIDRQQRDITSWLRKASGTVSSQKSCLCCGNFSSKLLKFGDNLYCTRCEKDQYELFTNTCNNKR